MIIKRIELIHIAIPLRRPFTTSFGTIADRPALIIKMTADDGRVGYGESSPLYVPMSEPETVTDGIQALKRILPQLLGLPVEKDLDITEHYRDEPYPVSLIGIEAAYLDLVAQNEGMSLSKLFGGTRSTIALGESIGIQSSVQDVIREISRYVDSGITRIKVKIAPGNDLETMRAVRDAFPSLELGADANAAYSASDVSHLAKLAELHLAFVEQPFAADDYDAHAALQKAGIPICLDETVRDLATCKRAVQNGACDMINIKPARIGSFKESRAIHDYCIENKVKLFGGGRLETGIGKTTNAAFYSLPGFTEPSDITPPLDYFEADVIEPPFRAHNGSYELPTIDGLGVNVREEIVKKFIKERFAFPA